MTTYDLVNKTAYIDSIASVYVNSVPVPGKDYEFYTIGDRISTQMAHIRFDAQGNYISETLGTATVGHYQLANELTIGPLMVMYPDGSKIICGSFGVIEDSSLDSYVTLPRGNLLFASYAIDGTANIIYAAANNKSILGYKMGSFQVAKTYNTLGIPQKVFYDNGKVICVSSTSSWANYYNLRGNTFVEQF